MEYAVNGLIIKLGILSSLINLNDATAIWSKLIFGNEKTGIMTTIDQ